MVRPEPSIQENAAFQETVADFYKLHGDPQLALIYIDRAIQINPKSLSVLIKNLHIFSQAKDIELRELGDKPIASTEAQRLLEEYSRRSTKIIEHPDATKAMKVEGLSYQANIARELKNFPLEMQTLNKIIDIDPSNKEAHQRRFEYFISKGLSSDAIESMKRITRDKLDSHKNWNAFLELLFNADKWEDLISWSNKAPAQLLSANPEIRIRLTRAYLELGRVKEAKKIMPLAPQNLSAKSAKLAEQNLSRLREIEADKLKEEGRLSEALDEYKTALKTSPRPLTVKEKISLLIYEYRKGLDFKPIEATQKDLTEVVNLLEDSVYKTELKSNLFGIYFHSVKLTKASDKLKRACARFKELYPELLRTKDYISYCQ
jgi:tetratricopeptide (TPR) repeat protein